jgi:hypothetical protein
MLMNDESEEAGEGAQTVLAETPAAKNEAPAAEENEKGKDDHHEGDDRPEENGGGEKTDDTPKETPLEEKEAEVQAGNE